MTDPLCISTWVPIHQPKECSYSFSPRYPMYCDVICKGGELSETFYTLRYPTVLHNGLFTMIMVSQFF